MAVIIMREAEYLREQAQECRVTAQKRGTKKDRDALLQLASYYEKEASRLDANSLRAMQYRF